jgi:hypothetical protein
MFLAQIIEGALAEIKCCSLMPAVSLGVLAAILAVYSIVQGATVIGFLSAVLQGGFTSAFEVAITGLLVFLIGGILSAVDSITAGNLVDTIYLVIIAVALVYYLWVTIRAAVHTTQWQQKIVEGPMDR